jgi:serine/threonine protein phosphatase PrpC
VGDFYLRPAVCCIPYLSESIEIVSSSSFRLILGCDGLFDELPDALVAQLSSLKEEEEEKKSENTQIVSERLRDAAVALGSTDNISAIVIDL